MQSERRKYLRVLFEENIEVHTASWKDFRASSLDISLSGVRFHCESSLSEMEELTVILQPDLKLKGRVSWCWPVEWYYQSAIEFIEMTSIERQHLRKYISEVTGEIYPDYTEEKNNIDPDEQDIEVFEDPLLQTLVELTPLSFVGKRVLLFDDYYEHTVLVEKYLSQRNQFEVIIVKKTSLLFQKLETSLVDLIILGWNPKSKLLENLSCKNLDDEISFYSLGRTFGCG